MDYPLLFPPVRAPIVACGSLALAMGCSAPPQVQAARATANTLTAESRPANTIAVAVDRPVAIVGGQPISWDEIRPRLVEMSGAIILEEILVERMLRQELARTEISIDDAAIAQEAQSALEALSSDSARAAQLLQTLRDAQALGEARWAALLWRNAALRALARRDVRMTEEHVREAFDVAHGPRRVARLIVVPDVASASDARARIAAGEPFGEVAARLSTDSSAQRGGMLAPIAKLDPSFPPAFRDVLFALKQDEISQSVLLENGYAIVQLCREIPGDGADPAATRAECERIARRAQERIEMDRIARLLARKATPTLFDDAMAESWQRQLRGQR